MDSLLELLSDVDDLCQTFLPQWNQQLLSSGQRQRGRDGSLTTNEITTILIAFHQSHFRELFDVQLITKLRANMKNQLMLFSDRLLLRRRAIIETIIDQLKNISQIEHSRHRCVTNFNVNVLCGFIAYYRRPIKPSLTLDICLPAPA